MRICKDQQPHLKIGARMWRPGGPLRYSLAAVSLCVAAAHSQAADSHLIAGAESCLQEPGSQVRIDGATFVMGDDQTYREEGPAHEVTVSGFWIDSHEVTNAQFAKFVAETGHVTVAERPLDAKDWPGAPAESLAPGSALFVPPEDSQNPANWWIYVAGASWGHPQGPGSTIEGMENYPVVHVAYEDAEAYADWAGRELPTEAQFELAARSKRNGTWPWDGDELAPEGHHRANTWQGTFPAQNTGEDRHAGVAPAGCYDKNDYGAHDLIGNVWEWTSNWYAPGHIPGESVDPKGPAEEQSFDYQNGGMPVKVIKGGSFLCAPNYCLRYRPAARQSADTGLGTSHIGFRTVLND